MGKRVIAIDKGRIVQDDKAGLYVYMKTKTRTASSVNREEYSITMFIRGIGHAIKQAFIQIFRNRPCPSHPCFHYGHALTGTLLYTIVNVSHNGECKEAVRYYSDLPSGETDRATAVRMIDELSKMDGVAHAWYLSGRYHGGVQMKWGDKAYLLDGLRRIRSRIP